jgi:hypothetical protein
MDKQTMGSIAGVLGIILVCAVITLIAWVVINGRRFLLARVQKELQAILAECKASEQQRDGYVRIRFPVYIGAGVGITELTPNVWMPKENARRYINTVTLVSLKYGLFTLLFPYVLFMVLVNYLANLAK